MFEIISVLLLILFTTTGYFALRTRERQTYLEAEKATFERRLAEKDSALREAELKHSDARKRIEGLTIEVAKLSVERA